MGLAKIAHYTEHVSPAGLAGKKLWPWYGSEYTNSATPLLPLGAKWDLVGDIAAGGGNSFMYVKNTTAGAISQGQHVTFATPSASTVTAAGSTKKMIVWAAGGLTVNAEVGNILYVANSTASGGGFTLRKILSNTATTITVSTTDPNVASKPDDQNAFEEIPTNGDVAIIIRPYQIIQGTAALVPCGIALSDVTAGYYTIVQTKGLALCSCKGDGTALVSGVPAVGGASGLIIGSGGTANMYNGPSIVSQAGFTAASGLSPCLINLEGQI